MIHNVMSTAHDQPDVVKHILPKLAMQYEIAWMYTYCLPIFYGYDNSIHISVNTIFSLYR